MPGMIRPDLQALPQHFQLAEKVEHSRPAGLPFDTTGLLQTEGNSGTIATGDTVLRDLFSLFPAYIREGDPISPSPVRSHCSFSPHTQG